MFFIHKLKTWEQEVFLHYFVTFMCIILKKLFSVYKFPHWFRYVDDAFILVPYNTTLPVCCVWLIQFSLEVEKDNCLSFLDVLVSNHFNQFSTNVLRKSFSVSLQCHAHSNHLQQKIAAFYTYVYRVLQICSDPSNLDNEIT